MLRQTQHIAIVLIPPIWRYMNNNYTHPSQAKKLTLMTKHLII